MLGVFGIVLTAALFGGLPAWLLADEYSFAIGAAYFSVSVTLLSIFWELQGINAQLKAAAASALKP